MDERKSNLVITDKAMLKKYVTRWTRGDRSMGHISTWDVSRVTNMDMLFAHCIDFDENISAWNTENVTSMKRMFARCERFNKPVTFSTINVVNMVDMFSGCVRLNSEIRLDTQNVLSMSGMFSGCESFNQNINFDTRSVTNMANMFSGCESLNQNINLDTRSVTNMANMFSGCESFNQNINFDTRSVTTMVYMFSGCKSLNSDIYLDTSRVVKMDGMFKDCKSFNKSVNFNTSSVVTVADMFKGCVSLNQDIDLTLGMLLHTQQGYKSMFRQCKFDNISITVRECKLVGLMFSDVEFNECKINILCSEGSSIVHLFSCFDGSKLNDCVININSPVACSADATKMFYNSVLRNTTVNIDNKISIVRIRNMFYSAEIFESTIDNLHLDEDECDMSFAFFRSRIMHSSIKGWKYRNLNGDDIFRACSIIDSNLFVSTPRIPAIYDPIT